MELVSVVRWKSGEQECGDGEEGVNDMFVSGSIGWSPSESRTGMDSGDALCHKLLSDELCSYILS
jgi:hypothetical protein